MPAPALADPDRFDEAVEAFRRRVPMTDAQWKKLSAAEQRHAFTVAHVAEARVVQEVFDAIDQAVEAGTTFEDFVDEVGPQLTEAWGAADSPRMEAIFRTNVMQSYNEGRDEIFSHPEVRKARPYFRVDDVDDSRECPICEPLHGLVLPADDPFWDKHQFPLHPNCRCIKTALTDEEAQDEGVADGPPTDREPPADGFGQGEDFEPDYSSFDPGIARELRARLL